jgi:hypothetical protein
MQRKKSAPLVVLGRPRLFIHGSHSESRAHVTFTSADGLFGSVRSLTRPKKLNISVAHWRDSHDKPP